MWIFLVEQDIMIEANINDVWKYIISFEQQRKWSPWLTIESDCKLIITWENAKVGNMESWAWNIIGEGEREVTNIIEWEFIDYQIRFKKPYAMRVRAYISLQKCGKDCTTVVWAMEWNLPWYMNLMKSKMQAYIEADYKRGLDMLKYLVETGHTPTDIKAQGTTEHHETFTVWIQRTSSVTEIPERMSKDFQTLWKFVSEKQTGAHGARSYYTDIDMKKDSYTYRSSILLSRDEFIELDEATLRDDIVKYYYPEGKTYSLRMTGSYNFMGNAWNAVFMHIKAKKLKINTKFPSFEDYINDPSHTPDHKRITDLSVYVK